LRACPLWEWLGHRLFVCYMLLSIDIEHTFISIHVFMIQFIQGPGCPQKDLTNITKSQK
jgi:hypothetical protein